MDKKNRLVNFKTLSRPNQRSRFLLPQDQIAELAQKFLIPPKEIPDGREERADTMDPSPFSAALEAAVIDFFTLNGTATKAWEAALPVALGSWARGELTPKSDLDLFFVGDEAAIAEVTRHAQEAGVKIRSRTPEDLDDWTKGVEPFDVLALFSAKPLTLNAKVEFEKGFESLRSRVKKRQRSYFKTLRSERSLRGERFDSIANYLEPNLKHGPGGLRDLGQAFQLRNLFPDRFQNSEREHALQVYEYYRRFFLMTRIRSQVSGGGGDLLSAHEQADIAAWFGFDSSRDFMREIQKGLSRVSFYTDVDFEHVRVSEKELLRFQSRKMDFVQMAEWLEKEPTVLVQAKARDTGFRLYKAALRSSETEKKKSKEVLSRLLSKTVDPLQDDSIALAFFRSRWVDMAVTDFKKVVGYVQHDQYHRYTVDAHLLQAIREMKRVAARPTVLGRLSGIAKSMTREDWTILGWTALYHDVGKGSGGDHSDKSVVIAREDLSKQGLKPEIIDEIIWLIENHLELSLAAFRGNPASPTTWRKLQSKGVVGKRLRRLTIFTCVDIRATNREAYTPWKERLLFELLGALEKPEAMKLAQLEAALLRSQSPKSARRGQFATALLDRLDPFLVAALPTRVLAEDLVTVGSLVPSGATGSSGVRVLKRSKDNRLWIRFHVSEDRPGLFVKMARTLQMAGLSVRHASVLSEETLGVYDWFEVKPPSNVKGLELRISKIWSQASVLSSGAGSTVQRADVFEEIEGTSGTDAEWVLSFRGRDTKGALLAAAEALADEGLSIAWAKVHTWGRQIDDVFGIVPPEKLSRDELVERLKVRFGLQVGARNGRR